MTDDSLTITIPGEMRGKGRPKFSTRGGFARAYTDAKTANAETWIRACAMEQVGQTVLEGPLAVSMAVTVAVPASWSKKRQTAALFGEERPTGKPDADNSLKLVADALNKIVWRDDSQIVEITFSKRYGTAAETVLTVSRPVTGKVANAGARAGTP